MDSNTGMATLPFLDVLIHRSPTGISYSVFRKPSHVHSYIHYYSNYAPHVKKEVLGGLFTRAHRISSPEHLQSELDILWVAFKKLGYPHFFIREALSASQSKFYAFHPSSITSHASTSITPNHTPYTPYNHTAKVINLPYHQQFTIVQQDYTGFQLQIGFHC